MRWPHLRLDRETVRFPIPFVRRLYVEQLRQSLLIVWQDALGLLWRVIRGGAAGSGLAKDHERPHRRKRGPYCPSVIIGGDEDATHMSSVARMRKAPIMGPKANPDIKIPIKREKAAARDPSGVKSET